MIIYLDGLELISSQTFSREEVREREKSKEESEHRGYVIYTWNSKGKLFSKEDSVLDDNNDAIMVYLREFDEQTTPDELDRTVPNEFLRSGFGIQSHEIELSSYNSFIPIYRKSAMELIKELEKKEIDCLLNDKGGPVVPRRKYLSPRLEKLLNNPVKKIIL